MKLTPPALLAPLLAQPAAIFGGGVSGRAAHLLVGQLGGTAVTYDEQGPDGLRSTFAPGDAAAHPLVIYSPGFAPHHPWLAIARAAGCVCLGEIDFAALCWRGRVIAITGTNGKTTLTEFIAHALRSLGRDAMAVGNTGHAFSQLVAETGGGADTTAVCEISSFQAETLQHFKADAVLWTNFAEDHLERHPALADYFLAKWRLAGCAPQVYAGTSVAVHAQKFSVALPGVVWVPTAGQPADPQLNGTVFARYPQRENYLLAAAWWRAAGHDGPALRAAAQTFALGPHRLAPVARVNGVTWWNDSKATNFHAAEAALAGFAAPVLLIAGGKSKGGDLAAFVGRIAPRVSHALLIGETRAALAAACLACGVAHTVCGDLAAAVQRAATLARPGGHVLLSPAFASFDQFKGYADRGAQFVALVHALAPRPAPLAFLSSTLIAQPS